MTTVCVYEDPTMWGAHGITASVKHQKKALRATGVSVKEKPREPYDVIHFNWPAPISYLQLIQAKKRGKLCVVFAHSGKDIKGGFTLSHFFYHPFINWLVRYYNKSDLVVAPSSYTRDMVSQFGVDKSKIRVISNGVDTENVKFSSRKRELYRKRFGLEKPTVITVGQVIPRKAVRTFVQAAYRLPEYQFIWYGHRMNKLLMYDKKMDGAIKNAPSNLQFSGYVEDIKAAYSSGDLFFFPSHEENQGIVLLEAAICGLPLVVRGLPVYRGWLKDGINCLKGKNLNEFIKLIKQVMKDSSLKKKLTRNAYQMAQNHRLEKIGQELVKQYKEFR